jgi:hypothetical protein
MAADAAGNGEAAPATPDTDTTQIVELDHWSILTVIR